MTGSKPGFSRTQKLLIKIRILLSPFDLKDRMKSKELFLKQGWVCMLRGHLNFYQWAKNEIQILAEYQILLFPSVYLAINT